MTNKLPDWLIRAIKTFVQAFLGVLIPEAIALLNSGLPESWSAAWAIFTPVLCASLAAGISAVWNYLKERWSK